jgi:H+/gluconate symporter-like permease
MGLLGIAVGLLLLLALAFRGWSILLLAPAAALIAALFAGEPPLAHWTQTFMGVPRISLLSSSRCSCSAHCSGS